MYKVIDVAKMLGVSKVTIYKKISNHKKELKVHMKKVKNITYLNDEAVDIIRNNINNQTVASGRIINDEIDDLHKQLDNLRQEKKQFEEALINQVRIEIDELGGVKRSLESQINVKMSHIERKDQMLETFKEIVKVNKDRIKHVELILENQKDF